MLVGLRRFARERVAAGAAAAVTFFVVSVVSTAVALLGAALLYAATGALHLSAAGRAAPAPLRAARHGRRARCCWSGFAFKVAAVPLHAWAPATYDGAPLPVAAYLSTASKLGGVIALLASVGAAAVAGLAGPVLAVLAVLTMTVGNLVALRQTPDGPAARLVVGGAGRYILAPLGARVGGRTAVVPVGGRAGVHRRSSWSWSSSRSARWSRCAGAAPTAATIADYRGAAPALARGWARALVLALAGLAGLPPGLAGLFAKVTVVGAADRRRLGLARRSWWRSTR